MTYEEKMAACVRFFEDLSKALEDNYSVLGSCNHDTSVYLVPIGTEDQVSYYGKPKRSFRISDHWNWFAALRKCYAKNYVQCNNVDMPLPYERELPWKSSVPVRGIQVAFFGRDGRYHCVFGERYDRKTRSWEWIEGTIDEAIKMAVAEA